MWPEHPLAALAWLLATLAIYAGSRALHRRFLAWWSSPLLLTWVSLLVLVPMAHSDYRTYLGGTAWLGALLGPATISFALPIYDQRALIRRYWPVLMAGVLAGSVLSVVVSAALAHLLHFSPVMELSLFPRSVTTPFAMIASQEIGGVPGITASFVAITGIFGATVGPVLIRLLRLRSGFARGAMLGMGAHGAGVGRAYQLSAQDGSVASTVMVLAGLLNVLVAVGIAALMG